MKTINNNIDVISFSGYEQEKINFMTDYLTTNLATSDNIKTIITYLSELSSDTIIHYSHVNTGDFHIITLVMPDNYFITKIPSHLITDHYLKYFDTINIFDVYINKIFADEDNYDFFNHFYYFLYVNYIDICHNRYLIDLTLEEKLKKIGYRVGPPLLNRAFGFSDYGLEVDEKLKLLSLTFNKKNKYNKPSKIILTFNN